MNLSLPVCCPGQTGHAQRVRLEVSETRSPFMNFARGFAVAVIVLSGQAVSAQDLSRYRDFVLESSVDTVAAASGVRATEAQTLHERPAKI